MGDRPPRELLGAIGGAVGTIPLLPVVRDLASRFLSPAVLPGAEKRAADIKAATYLEAAVFLFAIPAAVLFFGEILPRLLESRSGWSPSLSGSPGAVFALSAVLWRLGASPSVSLAAGALAAACSRRRSFLRRAGSFPGASSRSRTVRRSSESRRRGWPGASPPGRSDPTSPRRPPTFAGPFSWRRPCSRSSPSGKRGDAGAPRRDRVARPAGAFRLDPHLSLRGRARRERRRVSPPDARGRSLFRRAVSLPRGPPMARSDRGRAPRLPRGLRVDGLRPSGRADRALRRRATARAGADIRQRRASVPRHLSRPRLGRRRRCGRVPLPRPRSFSASLPMAARGDDRARPRGSRPRVRRSLRRSLLGRHRSRLRARLLSLPFGEAPRRLPGPCSSPARGEGWPNPRLVSDRDSLRGHGLRDARLRPDRGDGSDGGLDRARAPGFAANDSAGARPRSWLSSPGSGPGASRSSRCSAARGRSPPSFESPSWKSRG